MQNYKKKHITFLVFLFFLSLSVQAQSNDNDWIKKYVGEKGNSVNKKDLKNRRSLNEEDRFFRKLALSYSLSSMGIGVNAVTPLSKSVNLRGGFNYLPSTITIHKVMSVDDSNLQERVDGPADYNVNFKPNLFHGNILFDIYPSQGKPFHFVLGAYIGVGDVQARGRLKNKATGANSILKPERVAEGWPWLNVEGYQLDINDGILNVDIRMGKIIKPYVGIGFGHTMPRDKKMSFNFEIGVAYQGNYEIRQFGRKAPTMDMTYTSSAIDIKKYANYVKVWPMVSFQLNHRLF